MKKTGFRTKLTDGAVVKVMCARYGVEIEFRRPITKEDYPLGTEQYRHKSKLVTTVYLTHGKALALTQILKDLEPEIISATKLSLVELLTWVKANPGRVIRDGEIPKVSDIVKAAAEGCLTYTRSGDGWYIDLTDEGRRWCHD